METEFILDCRQMRGKRKAHTYIAGSLSFPDYYGHNLDALYDCLREMPEAHIILQCPDALGEDGYGAALKKTFFDAAADNPRLRITEKEL